MKKNLLKPCILVKGYADAYRLVKFFMLRGVEDCTMDVDYIWMIGLGLIHI